jgi:hypothetical protein
VQWYGNAPAVGNVMLKFAPGAMLPEFHTFASDVDVCAMLSLLTHLTVPPRGTVTGFGLYAFVVNVRDPDTIEIDVVDGVGDGLLGVELPPQLTAANAAAKTRLGANTDQRIRSPPATHSGKSAAVAIGCVFLCARRLLRYGRLTNGFR